METIINYSIGVFGIIIGIATSFYFYKKSIRAKEPVYSIKSVNLISGSISTLENLSISYKDKKIENLTVSKILFFNRGAETIDNQDLETINHLGVLLKNSKILDASILEVNNLSNNLTLQKDTNDEKVYINFDYLDANQGGVIQLIHTGTSSDNLEIGGDIKGVRKIIDASTYEFVSGETNTRDKKLLINTGSIAFISYVVYFSILDNPNVVAYMKGNFWLNGLNNLIFLYMFLVSIFFILVFLNASYIFSKTGEVMPKGLEKFLN